MHNQAKTILFLTGTFRSGSTLLMNSLNVHPGILLAFQPFMHLFKMALGKYYPNPDNPSYDPNQPLGVFYFASDSDRESFARNLPLVRFSGDDLASLGESMRAALSTRENLHEEMKPAKLLNHLESIRPGPFFDILNQFLAAFAKAYAGKNVAVLGFKELYLEEFIDPFLQAGPLCKVILLIRDPRAVLASRNHGKYQEAAGGKYPILFVCRNWRRSVHQYLANRDRDNFLMVRYEDLVLSPRPVLEKVCAFLGLPFAEEMLNTDLYRDFSGNRWQSNSSFSAGPRIDAAAAARWETVLPEQETRIIEYFCGPEMECTGYASKFAVVEEDLLSYVEEENQIRPWLRHMGFSYSPESVHEEKSRREMLRSPAVPLTDGKAYANFNGPGVRSNLLQANHLPR